MIGIAYDKASKVETCTREKLLSAASSTTVTGVCADLMDALEGVKRGGMKRKEFEEYKKQRKQQTSGWWVLTPHATFKDGHRTNAAALPTGLYMFDIDHMQGDPRVFFNQKVQPRLQELGILLAHVTPSTEGLRLVAAIPAQLREAPDAGIDAWRESIKGAQAWLAHELGTAYDPSTNDLARMSFVVPSDYFLHIDDRIFGEAEKIPAPNPTMAVMPQDVQTSTPAAHSSLQRERPAAESRLFFKGVLYSDIIQRYWQKTGGEPVEGERNVRLYQLAANLRAICDNSPSKLIQVMPRYGLSESELESIVRSACKEPVKGSRVINEILKSQTPEVNSLEDENNGDAENSPESTHLSSLLSPLSSKRLPPALRASLAGVPQNMWWPVLAATLPIQAALADGVEVEYCDGARQRLALMTIVVGDQASGKSTCKQTVDIWKRVLEREDADARKREDEWKQKKKNRKANERCPEDPEVMIRVLPVTVSCSTLLKRFKNSRGHTLYSFGEELDTLRKTNGAGSWSSKYDIYRLGFDHGEWGQDYNSDQAESGMVNVAYNWTMLGTYGALRKCFSKDNVENGLSSRVIVAEMPDNAFAPMPHYGRRTAHHEAIIEEAAQRLREVRGFVDTPRLRKAIGQWVEEKRLEAMAKIDRVMDTYRKRAAVIGFRAGVVCHLLSGEARETKATLDFALAVAELTLKGQMSVFGEALSDQLSDGKPTLRKDSNKTVLDQLPREFTLADLQQLKQGFASPASLHTIICRWSKAGWVEKTDARHWKKITI